MAKDGEKNAVDQGIEKMYKIYEKLNSAQDKTTLESDFKELLKAVKRSDKEKRLASQFITRFLEFFPLLYDIAINAMLDLCEDDDIAIRKQVCKDLITVCKKVSTFVPKIADVFSQLMQTDDAAEHKSLESCLISLFHIDAQAAVVGMFSQITNGEEVVRERCLKFLTTKLKDLSPEITNADFEKCLVAEARRCAPELSGEDFKQLHTLFLNTKMSKTVSGQQLMVDIVSDILEMDKPFDASEAESFEKLLACTKFSLSAFSNQVSSTSYLVYYCTKVLPNLGEAVMLEKGVTLKLGALRMLADISSHVSHLDSTTAKKCLEPVFKLLLELMPLPPEDDNVLNPKFEFSYIEGLLFTLHKIGGLCPEFLAEDDRLKEFRIRLQYLARGTQAYMKKLREELQGKSGAELRSDENRSKIQGLKLTTNITAVIKDLFHTPPTYKSIVGLSWRPMQKTALAAKRPSMESARGPVPLKQSRGVLYQPPSGKFSSKAGSFSNPQGGNRNGSRGGGRRSGPGGQSGFRGRRGGRGRGRY